MSTIEIPTAYYIKLGQRGIWEADCIETGKLRLGWKYQTVEDINSQHWEIIEGQLGQMYEGKPAGVVTRDLNALKIIAGSEPHDIWITFHQAKLWWAQLAPGPVEEDGVSKFRRTAGPWRDHSTNGKLLIVNNLSGKIAQLQGFRGTVCRVDYIALLQRTVNGTRSPLADSINDQRRSLSETLAEAITELHWKDFETLVDLIFRYAGWKRESVLGQQAKAYDLALRDPIIGDRYVVEVKSQAGLSELNQIVEQFSAEDFRRVFFVVHSPKADLIGAEGIPKHVDIILPQRLGELAMEAGLFGWIEDKIS